MKSTFQLPESRKKNLGNFFSRRISWRRRKRNVRNGNARNIKEKNVTVVDYFVLPIDIGFNELASPFGIIFTSSGFAVI